MTGLYVIGAVFLLVAALVVALVMSTRGQAVASEEAKQAKETGNAGKTIAETPSESNLERLRARVRRRRERRELRDDTKN